MIRVTSKLKVFFYCTALMMSVFLGGCFATGTPFQQTVTSSPGMANVYVYRTKGFVGILVSQAVYLDNVKVASIRDGGYILLHVVPGQHTLQIIDQSGASKYITNSLSAMPGKNYYFRIGGFVDFSRTNYIAGSRDNNYAPLATPGFTNELVLVPSSEALQQLSSLRLSN